MSDRDLLQRLGQPRVLRFLVYFVRMPKGGAGGGSGSGALSIILLVMAVLSSILFSKVSSEGAEDSMR